MSVVGLIRRLHPIHFPLSCPNIRPRDIHCCTNGILLGKFQRILLCDTLDFRSRVIPWVEANTSFGSTIRQIYCGAFESHKAGKCLYLSDVYIFSVACPSFGREFIGLVLASIGRDDLDRPIVPDESEIEFHNIVSSLVEVEDVRFNASVLSSLIKIFLDHLQKLCTLRNSRKGVLYASLANAAYHILQQIYSISRFNTTNQPKKNRTHLSLIIFGMQTIDKTTRNRIFNSRFWKEECFALNAETFIDIAIKVKCVGGLYSGSKRPTKFLCLVFKMLQMNLPDEIVFQYLRAVEYKYLNAMALVYLRLTHKASQVYELLEPFYVDNRKLVAKDAVGRYEIMYMDELVDKLLHEEVVMGVALPFIQKRIALEEQGVMQPRVSTLEQELNEEADRHDM